MNMPLVCTSKNIWAELSYEVGPSCLIKLGRVGMGRVLCGPSWHGPSWFWAELSVIQSHDRAALCCRAEICRARNKFSLSRFTRMCNSIIISLYQLQVVLLTKLQIIKYMSFPEIMISQCLETWEETWQMSFNPSECINLRIAPMNKKILQSECTFFSHTAIVSVHENLTLVFCLIY